MLSKQTAYEKWLGIKDQQQPPTLYRLLGVEAFESDADIISNSADSRMGYLRQFQIGDSAPIAAEILNELSQARVTLLNADKKAAYDARLRQRMAPQNTADSTSNSSPQAAASPLPRDESGAEPTNSTSVGRHKKKISPLVWIAPVVTVVLVLGTVAVVNSLSGGGEDSSPANAPKAVVLRPDTAELVAHPVAPEPSISPKSLDKSPTVVPDPVVVAPAVPKTPTPTPPPVAVANSESPPPDSEKPIQAAQAEPPKAPAIVAPAPTEPALIPVPDISAQAAATKLIKEIYGKEWTDAKTAEQKQFLAKKLLEKAAESEKDRAAQFVLLRLSRQVAEQATDFEAAFDAIKETAKVFQVDALDMEVDALKKCGSAATTGGQHKSVAEKAAEVSDREAAKDDFAVAKPMIDLALGEAGKAKDEVLITRTLERKAEIDRSAEACEVAQAAVAILEKTPLDPAANLAVGKYKCFFKGDWESGLPKLALGDDLALKALAQTELKGAASSDEQSKLGDSWWNAAENQKGAEKKQIQARAGYWYQRALPSLTGLQKDKVEKRIEEGNESEEATSPAPTSTDKWVLLFRSADPSIWNTNTHGKGRFAIRLSRAPQTIGYLRMRLNPKEFVIIPMTNEKLGGLQIQDNFGWQGDNHIEWGGHQLGIFDRKTPRNSDGDITIHWEQGLAGLSGWGFGYRHPGNYQGCAWGGRAIRKSVIEISVTSSSLTPTEQRQLLK